MSKYIVTLTDFTSIIQHIHELLLDFACQIFSRFGDAGTQSLCEGLEGNKTIISVSLNYCSLGIESGKTLGRIVSTTAVR